MFCLSMSSLSEALSIWAKQARLFTPQGDTQNAHFAPYNEDANELVLNPESYVNTAMPPKHFTFAENEPLFTWQGKENILINPALSHEMPNCIVFGLRPCDAYSLAYMHSFFGQEFADEHYNIRQKHLYTIAMNCTKPGEQCFCTANGGVTGPFASLDDGVSGCDLSFTPDFEKNIYWIFVHGP